VGVNFAVKLSSWAEYKICEGSTKLINGTTQSSPDITLITF